MMIIKSDSEIRQMRKAGSIAAGALAAGGNAVCPGISTKELGPDYRKLYPVPRGCSFL